ncbi:MAG: hypothetical protein Q9201_004378 [Fulgogasparrea decipioides]
MEKRYFYHPAWKFLTVMYGSDATSVKRAVRVEVHPGPKRTDYYQAGFVPVPMPAATERYVWFDLSAPVRGVYFPVCHNVGGPHKLRSKYIRLDFRDRPINFPFAVPYDQKYVSDFKRLKNLPDAKIDTANAESPPLNPADLPADDRDPLYYWLDVRNDEFAAQQQQQIGQADPYNTAINNFNQSQVWETKSIDEFFAQPGTKEKCYSARNQIYKEGRNKKTLTALRDAYRGHFEHYLKAELFAKNKKLDEARKKVNTQGRNEKTLAELNAAYTAFDKGNVESEQLISLDDIQRREDMKNATYWWDKKGEAKDTDRVRYQSVVANGPKVPDTPIKADIAGKSQTNALIVGTWDVMGENTTGLGWRAHKTLRCDVTELYYLLTLPRLMRDCKGDSNMPIDIYEYNLVLAFDAQDITVSMESRVTDFALSNTSKYVDYTAFIQSNFGLQMEYFKPPAPEDWVADFVLQLFTVVLGAIPYIGPVLSFAETVAIQVSKDPEWINKPQNIQPLTMATAVGQKDEIKQGLLLAEKYMLKALRRGKK